MCDSACTALMQIHVPQVLWYHHWAVDTDEEPVDFHSEIAQALYLPQLPIHLTAAARA